MGCGLLARDPGRNPVKNRRIKMSAKTDSANLDFLRIFAVLTVYFGHLLQLFHTDKLVGRLTIYDLAQTGVLIFFVHTSLVLMLSLDRLRIASARRLFAVFHIRRAFRIYPLSIATVVIMLAAHVPAFPDIRYSRPGFLALLANPFTWAIVRHSGLHSSCSETNPSGCKVACV
jgi:peptidoglycan/LPS O-acetylase OafA/YrhL